MSTLGIFVLVLISILLGFFVRSVIYYAKQRVKIGSPAPGFSAQLLDGSRIGQTDWHRPSKHLLLCFMSPQCSACRQLASTLNELSRTYERTDIQVLIMGVNGKREDFARWKKSLGLNMPVAVDVEGTAKLRYSVYSLPALFHISPGGLVRDIHIGYHPGDETDFEEIFRNQSVASTRKN